MLYIRCLQYLLMRSTAWLAICLLTKRQILFGMRSSLIMNCIDQDLTRSWTKISSIYALLRVSVSSLVRRDLRRWINISDVQLTYLANLSTVISSLSSLSISIFVDSESDDKLSSEIENMSKFDDSRVFSQAKAHSFKAATQDSQSLSYDWASNTSVEAVFWSSSKRAFMTALYESQTLSHSNVVVSHQTSDASSEVDFDSSSQRFFMTTFYEFQTLSNSSVPELHQADNASIEIVFWSSQRAFMTTLYESQTLLSSNIADLQQASDVSIEVVFWSSQRVFMTTFYESQTLLSSNIADFQQASDALIEAALWSLTQRSFIVALCTSQISSHDHFHYSHQASDVSMKASFLTVNTTFSRDRARWW